MHTGETIRIHLHGAATESALAIDSNPCYEAPNVKQIEAKEVHIYEMVQQNKYFYDIVTLCS